MKTLKLSALLIVAAVAMGSVSSCKKLVTPKKLDGTWTLSSGEMDSENTTTYKPTGTTTTTSMSQTIDGSTVTTVTTYMGTSTTTTSTMTQEYTFDKSTNEYTSTSVETDDEYSAYNNYVYQKDASGNYNGIYVYQVIAREATTEASGLYTITGDAGEEIEKNSQIVFQQDMEESTYTNTYTYYTDETMATTLAANTLYTYDYNTSTYVLVTATETGTTTSNGMSMYNLVWTISDLSKDEMTVEYTEDSDYDDSNSDYSYSSSTTGSMTLTKE